jgi:hypothetical protein
MAAPFGLPLPGVHVMGTRITGSTVRGAPIARAERVRTYAGNRICAAESCNTILSIYNPSKFCTLHSAPDRGSARRKPVRLPRQCECDHCGKEFETTNPVRKYCSDHCRMAAFALRQQILEGGRRRRRSRKPETVEVCVRQRAALEVCAAQYGQAGVCVAQQEALDVCVAQFEMAEVVASQHQAASILAERLERVPAVAGSRARGIVEAGARS